MRLVVSLAGEAHAVDIEVDVETEEALIFNLAVLSDHQDVLFRDQVIDAVCYLFGSLSSFLHRCALSFCLDNFLNDFVDNISLRCRLLSFALKFFHNANYHQ